MDWKLLLNLYEITYDYHKIVDKYSPTGKTDYFGQFEFCFEGKTTEVKKICEASSMSLYINKGKVVDCRCTDI